MTQMKVKILKSCWCGQAGDTKELHETQAQQLIRDRFAVEDTDHAAEKDARQAESQALQNKAFTAKDKREAAADKKVSDKAKAKADKRKAAEDEKFERKPAKKPKINDKAMSSKKK